MFSSLVLIQAMKMNYPKTAFSITFNLNQQRRLKLLKHKPNDIQSKPTKRQIEFDLFFFSGLIVEQHLILIMTSRC